MHTHTTRLRDLVDGVPAVAVLRCSVADLTVELIEPEPGWWQSLHIPGYALGGNRRFTRVGVTTDYARAAGRRILRHLVQVARLVANRRDELAAICAHDSVRPRGVCDEAFHHERRVLRGQLRSGLDPRVYQRRLGLARARRVSHAAEEHAAECHLAESVERAYGVFLSSDLVHQVRVRLCR